jgi:hypothetical protein
MTCMQRLWCWRCKCEVPMLDEDEYVEIAVLYKDAIKGTKEYRQRWGVSLENASIHERFGPVRTLYERLTGMKDCHQNAIMHHRILLYGPPCKRCQKPLRTPKAKLCGSCMYPVQDN